jgi:hypothetical protein
MYWICYLCLYMAVSCVKRIRGVFIKSITTKFGVLFIPKGQVLLHVYVVFKDVDN